MQKHIKPTDLITQFEQDMRDLQSRRSLILSDYQDSEANFRRRLDTLTDREVEIEKQIAALEDQKVVIQKNRRLMLENREQGPALHPVLDEKIAKLERKIKAVRAYLVQQELKKLEAK